MNYLVTRIIAFFVVISIFLPQYGNCAKILQESDSQESSQIEASF